VTAVTLGEIPAGRYGFGHVVRAELTKIRTLRSTFWTLLVTAVGTLAVTVLSTQSAGGHNHAWYQGFDPTNQALARPSWPTAGRRRPTSASPGCCAPWCCRGPSWPCSVSSDWDWA